MPTADDALTRLAREDSGRVLALLARRLGDLDLADEAVQDALLEAVQTWPDRGVPDNPPAWLLTVARRKALDRIRRTSSARRRTLAAAADLLEDAVPGPPRDLVDDDGDLRIEDERLRLMLLCCHPALATDAQVALTLRLVGGLTTDEIAAAYLQPEPTITQRIVRAKRKIRDAGIPLSIPAALGERVDVLLGVLYLIFNEGYLSRGDQPLRADLADEAIRLARVLDRLLPDAPEVRGLLALMLFQRSRFATRVDPHGRLVLLEHQDRSRWDGAMIAAANRVLATALRQVQPGAYQLQAVVAGLHANARTHADTDWSAIADAYAQLTRLTGSPVVGLNHAVAVGMADGPQAGLSALATVDGLSDYHLFHAARGDLLERSGDTEGARSAFLRAAELARSEPERELMRRRAEVSS